MKSSLSIPRILLIALVYVWAFASIAGAGGIGLFLFAAVYVIAAIITSNSLLQKDLRKTESGALRFRRFQPLTPFGRVLLEFQHVFNHDDTLEHPITAKLTTAFARYCHEIELRPIDITDRDRRLRETDTRRFLIAQLHQNRRGTELTLAVHFQAVGGAQSVQWWILGEGTPDINRRIMLLASSPVRLPFWIYKKLRGDYDLATYVQVLYDSFYNWADILTVAKSSHALVLDSLCEVLEEHGLDTSELKAQRAQVMNISVSGGKVRFGNVVQAVRDARIGRTTETA
jgi:hypothetical protein